MKTVALSEVAEILSGAGFPIEYQGHSDGDVPFAKVGDISKAKRNEGTTISSAENYVSFEVCKTLRAKIFPEGSIVFAKIGEAIRNGNKVMTKNPMAFDNNVMGIVPNCKKVFPRYLFHFIDSLDFYGLANSTTVPSIRKTDMESLSVWLPPLEEQKRIAAILDQADDLRRKRQRALDRLNQLGQAIFVEMFGDISQLPRTHTLDEIATIQQSLVDPKLPQYRKALHVGPEHMTSGAGTVNWDAVRTAHEDSVISGKNRFEEGDVLYSKIRPYLNKVALADRSGICSADMYVIKPIDQKSTAHFLKALLMGKDFLAYAETCSNRANIPKLNRAQVEGYHFHCPPFDEQRKFAKRMSDLDVNRTLYAHGMAASSLLFTSLQHRAFQGGLS